MNAEGHGWAAADDRMCEGSLEDQKIMEPKVEKAFPLRRAYPFAEEHGLAEEAHKIRDMDISWDLPYTSSVRRGFMIELFQKNETLSAFKEAHWPYGLTKGGESEVRRCLKIKAQFDARDTGMSIQEAATAD